MTNLLRCVIQLGDVSNCILPHKN